MKIISAMLPSALSVLEHQRQCFTLGLAPIARSLAEVPEDQAAVRHGAHWECCLHRGLQATYVLDSFS